MTKKLLLLALLITVMISCTKKDKVGKGNTKDKNGYEYKTVPNDPFGVREYKLKNGLKVFLSVNKEKPEVSTMIAVKAGSTYDPKETTGLAHYLEHLVFKGTDKIATSDWKKEEPILKQISEQFEKHKIATDVKEKTKIYAVIDSLSQEASKFAVPSEYDKMVSMIGAKGTNAFTSNEQTVYVNTIPSNQVDKWMTLESERFSKLVLRIFHTELETVYEEFNSGQSNDWRQVHAKFNNLLFPTHPYGTQTTLGKAEHLKNPSMVNIHNYWNKYYVANNMAIIMTGDLDFDETIVKIDKYFGNLREDKNLSHPTFPKEKEITTPVKATVYGPDAEFVQIGFRTEGANKKDNVIEELISMILYNGQAGLVDINLVKKQKVLKAYAYNSINKDYGQIILAGYAQSGQSLEDVEKLLLAEVEKIKKGEFDDWLIEAIINNEKLSELKKIEYNYYIYSILNSFILDVPWEAQVSRLNEMEKISKQQIIEHANKIFKDNFAVVYKKKGENKNIVTVDKPKITPISIDRTKESEFYKSFNKIPETKLKPDFINYKNKIKTAKIGEVEFNYIQNKNNELSSVRFILDMGKYSLKEIEVAVNFFSYIGTDSLSSEQLAKEYYKLGVYTSVNVDGDRSYISLSGLNKNLEKGLELFLSNIKNAKADKESLIKYISSLKKERANSKLSKWAIRNNLKEFAKFGRDNPTRYNLTNDELDKVDSAELVELINGILEYKHYILYYGPNSFDEALSLIKRVYTPSEKLKNLPVKKQFIELEASNKVYFTNYDMVQSNIILISRDEKFNIDNYAYISMFNEFYGTGLSSIVFQELRETKGLVYSAYSYMSKPAKKDYHHYLQASMTTQPDKMNDALEAMLGVLNNIQNAEKQFEDARKAALAKIETKRVTKSNIFWSYLKNKELGIDYNIDKVIYEKIKTMTYEDFNNFFRKHIMNKKFDIIVVGKKSDVDFNVLKNYGELKEISIDEIFNY